MMRICLSQISHFDLLILVCPVRIPAVEDLRCQTHLTHHQPLLLRPHRSRRSRNLFLCRITIIKAEACSPFVRSQSCLQIGKRILCFPIFFLLVHSPRAARQRLAAAMRPDPQSPARRVKQVSTRARTMTQQSTLILHRWRRHHAQRRHRAAVAREHGVLFKRSLVLCRAYYPNSNAAFPCTKSQFLSPLRFVAEFCCQSFFLIKAQRC